MGWSRSRSWWLWVTSLLMTRMSCKWEQGQATITLLPCCMQSFRSA